MKLILFVLLSLLPACDAQPRPDAAREVAEDVFHVGHLTHPRLTESSGIAMSRRQADVFWTHNDGGGKRQVLYAMTRSGQPLSEFRVTGVLLDDWEDIALDDNGHLYFGDIGNNDAKRQMISVHQADEPLLPDSSNGLVRIKRTWKLTYPKEAFDAEALVVWGEHGFVVSKVFNDERAGLFRFSLTNLSDSQVLEAIGDLKIESPVTGGALSADGRLLGLVAKNGAYVFRVDGDLSRATRGKPFQAKFRHEHIEGCTFAPEGLLATAESREIYLFGNEAFRHGPTKKK